MRSSMTVVHEESQDLKPLVFSKMELLESKHPLFRRVWYGRHIINQNSPLLTPNARKLVKANKGWWPAELNSAEGVRKSVQFRQLLVSLTGTANVNASAVRARKVYDYVDMNVGYRFARVLYIDEVTDRLTVDPSMLNDVREQNGGGREQFKNIIDGDVVDV